MRTAALVGGTLLVLLGATPAMASGPSKAQKKAQAAAKSALLRHDDLGSAWSQSSSPPQQAPELTCAAFTPHAELARAASATFSRSSNGPFASEIDAVFSSAGSLATWWKQTIHPKLGHCFEKELADGSSSQVKLKPRRFRMARFGSGQPAVVRYRVTGTATMPQQQVPVYLDVLMIRRGACVGELQISSFQTPPARSLELRLTHILAQRMSAERNK